MANAVSPGISQTAPASRTAPASSPGASGHNDSGDPTRARAARGANGGVTGAAPAATAAASAPGRPASAAGGGRTARFTTPGLPSGLQLDIDAFITAYEDVHEELFHSLRKPARPARRGVAAVPAEENTTRVNNLRRFLTSLRNDPAVDDVYKASYMLATAMHEGRCRLDDWQMTWSPVEETAGNGAAYWTPVYVRTLMTKVPLDKDGNEIEPLTDAHGASRLGRHRPSSIADANLPQYYPADKLIKRAFNGRGYVQVTWLENYLTLGETIGMGNQLACNPDLVMQHDVAFKITSMGMRLGCFRGNRTYTAGQGRVGGHKLADYGHDYVAARAIINGNEPGIPQKIADYATLFENLIQQCRLV